MLEERVKALEVENAMLRGELVALDRRLEWMKDVLEGYMRANVEILANLRQRLEAFEGRPGPADVIRLVRTEGAK